MIWRALFLLVSIGALAMSIWAEDRNDVSSTFAVPAASSLDVETETTRTANSIITEKPLFHRNRRPWRPLVSSMPPSPSPAAVVRTLSAYRLIGLVISGDTKTALLKRLGASNTISLTEGQELDGWHLTSVSADRAHFESGEALYDIAFPVLNQTTRVAVR